MRATRREQIEILADTLARDTEEKNINKIKWVLFKFFSLAEQKPTDTFSQSIFGDKSK
jgi:hypothetical protein